MTRYIALLRAVNVGGTGKLPMADLKSICLDAGFTRVETYIASGNVIFESKRAPSKVKATSKLASGLCQEAHCSRAAEQRRRWRPCSSQPVPNGRTQIHYAIFLDQRPRRDVLEHAVGQSEEI
jgi:hypothetical protein